MPFRQTQHPIYPIILSLLESQDHIRTQKKDLPIGQPSLPRFTAKTG